MRQRIAKISEETLMPLGLVIVVIGGVFLGGRSIYQTEANAKDIDKLELRVDDTDKTLTDTMMKIDRRLSRIEGALHIKEDAREKN